MPAGPKQTRWGRKFGTFAASHETSSCRCFADFRGCSSCNKGGSAAWVAHLAVSCLCRGLLAVDRIWEPLYFLSRTFCCAWESMETLLGNYVLKSAKSTLCRITMWLGATDLQPTNGSAARSLYMGSYTPKRSLGLAPMYRGFRSDLKLIFFPPF